MLTTRLGVWAVLLVWFSQVVPVFGQETVVPQGDPRFHATEQEAPQRERIHDSRLKQQGPNYRVEGEPQRMAGKAEFTAGDPNGLTRQDTGLADPSVNPGQASGMQSVQGRIIKSDGNRHIVRQLSGPDTTLTVDSRTAGDKDLHPGDVITGLISPQGRAVAIHKEP